MTMSDLFVSLQYRYLDVLSPEHVPEKNNININLHSPHLVLFGKKTKTKQNTNLTQTANQNNTVLGKHF